MQNDLPTSFSAFLKELNIAPLKSLSQNFLTDKNIIKKIVAAANIQEDDLILEIGPGTGALTQELTTKKAKIIAVEKDKTLAKYLSKKYPEIDLYEADFLKNFPLEEIFSKQKKKAKVVANLPYHISSVIIAKLLKYHFLFSEMIIMVQLEMAQRVVSEKDSKNYGSFTVFVNFYATTKLLFTVSPNCFFPKPKVTSAILKIIPKNSLPSIDKEKFHLFVQTIFQQRRKKINTILKKDYSEEILEKTFSKLKINPNDRPENLSCEDFYLLFEALRKKSKK